MAKKVSWALTLQVAGGVTWQESDALEAEGIEEIEAIIQPTTGASAGTLVEVQPSAAGQIELFVLTAKPYDDKLTYEVQKADGGTYEDAVQLNGPHILVGSGAVQLLTSDPKKIRFANKMDSGEEAVVRIFVGRDVNPPPAP